MGTLAKIFLTGFGISSAGQIKGSIVDKKQIKKELKNINLILKDIRDDRRRLLTQYRSYMNREYELKEQLKKASA